MDVIGKLSNFLYQILFIYCLIFLRKEKFGKPSLENLLEEATSNENFNPSTKILNEISEFSF